MCSYSTTTEQGLLEGTSVSGNTELNHDENFVYIAHSGETGTVRNLRWFP